MSQVAIVGGGISGCSIARILNSKGHVTTLFERSRLGGLVSCSFDNGHTYHRVGGHVFNSKIPEVLEWFWSHFDQKNEFLQAKRNAVILINGAFINYPIELNLAQLPADTGRRAVHDLLASASAAPRSSEVANFKEFLWSNFGDTLCQLYFIPYNQKIWQRDLATIPLQWLDGKLPMISSNEIIEKNMLKLRDDMVHSTFFYPKRGGSQFIIDRLAEELVIINAEVSSIDYSSGTYAINHVHDKNQAIVYTGDSRRLPEILSPRARAHVGLTEDLCLHLQSLPSNSTTTMLCECDQTDFSWVYLPGPETKCHRIIMTGNFSPSNSSPDLPPGRSTCTIEYSGQLSKEEMGLEIMKLPFAMKPIAYNYCPNSYIIHDPSTASLMNEFTALLARRGIFCCGRFAEWQYYNMDAAISSALSVAAQMSAYLA